MSQYCIALQLDRKFAATCQSMRQKTQSGVQPLVECFARVRNDIADAAPSLIRAEVKSIAGLSAEVRGLAGFGRLGARLTIQAEIPVMAEIGRAHV